MQTSGSAQTDANVHTSIKHAVGSGAGDIGKGAARGVGSAAKGTGKAAGDLVTLHPIEAATDLGKGAVNTGKNVGVGTVRELPKYSRAPSRQSNTWLKADRVRLTGAASGFLKVRVVIPV